MTDRRFAGSPFAGSIPAGSPFAGSIPAGPPFAGSIPAGSPLASSIPAGPPFAGSIPAGSLRGGLRRGAGLDYTDILHRPASQPHGRLS